ncbi:alpha/beta hydrolase family protein [Nocardia crassostreae]|uniref:alpha/beta hydrolase family protein n=1 Tax=Nocardia crassostreae TaxID=53428 RepID=UPI000834CE37|nr:alpha/beta fold hydrolase [Nocardia crassostreae]
MRSLLLALLVIVAFVPGCSQSRQEPPPRLTGDWTGTIDVPDSPLAVGVNFTNDNRATIDIPVQNVMSLPLTGVRTDRNLVTWAIPQVPGEPSFQGSYDADSNSIIGEFTQSGQQLPLTLTPGRALTPPRPQDPQPPFPYRSEEVGYPSREITIAGTLTLPQTPGPHPAVVLITGSGRQDRNENILGHKPFLLLADVLTRAGYAVLRTDDRGVGGTGGNLDHATYQDLTDDIAAGMTYLRTRSEIDGNRIGLLGHSEGGYLAPLAAARPESGVAFVILLSGPSVTGAEVLLEQTQLMLAAEGATPQEVSSEIGFLSGLCNIFRIGDLEEAIRYAHQHNAGLPAEQRAPAEAVDALVTQYMASLVVYDPAPALSALRIPVLALYGSKDIQVPLAQNEAPMRALLAADPAATVHVFDGLNHLFQVAGTGLPEEYATIDTTIDPQVLDYLTAWVSGVAPPR